MVRDHQLFFLEVGVLRWTDLHLPPRDASVGQFGGRTPVQHAIHCALSHYVIDDWHAIQCHMRRHAVSVG